MNRYRETAEKMFLEGYSCSQSVFLAFSEELGVDGETAAALSAPFGGGMGRLREVCGAVSGMFLALGALYGPVLPGETDKKAELYRDIQMLAQTFEERNGSIICRELLGISGRSDPTPGSRTADYYAARASCRKRIGDAAEIFGDYLERRGRL